MRGYRDGDLVNKLIETLKKQGVTEDSIVLEWPINHRHRVDLAIIDKVLNKPIALFEIKQTRDKKTVACAESQVKKYASILDEQNIPLFIVFPDPKNDGFLDITQVKFELVKKEPEKTELKEKIGLKDSFEIIVERKEDQLKTSQDQIPNISVLTNSARQKTLFELLKKKENAIENFQLVCWIMGFSSLVHQSDLKV